MDDVQQRIDELVKNNRVVLFMKGSAQFPMCGFSGRAIQVLKACGVTDLTTVNVLEDEGVRQGDKIKLSRRAGIRHGEQQPRADQMRCSHYILAGEVFVGDRAHDHRRKD